MSDAYKQAGVDLELGNTASDIFYNALTHTWPNRQGLYGEIIATEDSFSGFRAWSIAPLLEVPDMSGILFDQDADGTGTKVEVSQRTKNYGTIAYDLFAMACDDPAVRGFEPAVVTTVLDVNVLKDMMVPDVRALSVGLIGAAATAGVAVKGGETATLGKLVGGYGDPAKNMQYNWSATVNAVGHRDRVLTGQEIKPGDTLVAFQEKGFRSNGLSLVRDTFSRAYGPYWHRKKVNGAQQLLGEAVLTPSIIYSGALVDMTGGYDLRRPARANLHGAAHITGGGIPEKVQRMLAASGYGADIESPFEPTELMQHLQQLSGVKDKELYTVINMGQGMIIATPDPERVQAVALEHDILSKQVGVVTQKPGVRIRSAGTSNPGKKLTYNK